MDWETSVFQYIPSTVKPPSEVTEDGRGGVIQATFDAFVSLVKDKIEDRLAKYEMSAPDWTGTIDPSLQAAASQLVAAYILRKFPAYESLYKDYFANAFATLDEHIESERAKLGLASNTPEFVDDEEFVDGFPDLF